LGRLEETMKTAPETLRVETHLRVLKEREGCLVAGVEDDGKVIL